MLCADLSEASASSVAWRRVAAVPAGSPLSSEGISLLHCPELGLLVAFGGYNGKYHNAVSVFKLPAADDGHPAAPAEAASAPQQHQRQSLEAGPQQQQQQQAELKQQQQQQAYSNGNGSAAAASSAPAPAPAIRSGGSGSFGAAPQGESLLRELAVARETLKRDLAAAQAAAAEAQQQVAAAQESAGQEIALLRRQLSAAQAALGDAERSLDDARHQLSAEQARTLKLEATVAELNERLAQVGDLERELGRYRKMDSEGRKGSGIWGYITGTPAAAGGGA
ncbi:hypothetical protein MNEG_1616 [Monoraphidium neglectum]|uniref:Acyl-CoA-binding domain-containing protein n=1 Tax=Monoraphidium neglectum TaxID=145388 RepID=A0A0D2N1E7_9CHLO|nr:hypothetical protein MNEG_1616 [Monoraphidium neglectum]KIZ06352.1 hypothetical protein MNEG_1616 [Monoraphidium neglectum]|eukprot:XP_013905371.1 hypothetical protein MNEG_1616 [Monoraphidium neglectum]